MVYLPRCDSPKSEAGSFTSDSALDRSHDGGEFETKTPGFGGWRRAHFTPLRLCRVQRCLLKFEFRFFSKPWLVICRRRPGCRRLVNGEAESSDGVAAASHRPPASLADHHTSEFESVSDLSRVEGQCCHRVCRLSSPPLQSQLSSLDLDSSAGKDKAKEEPPSVSRAEETSLRKGGVPHGPVRHHAPTAAAQQRAEHLYPC